MRPKLIARIAHEVPAVACIKLEALPTPARIAALRKLWASELPPASDCTILTGLGALYAGARASERASLPRPFRPRPFARPVPQALTWSRGRTAS